MLSHRPLTPNYGIEGKVDDGRGGCAGGFNYVEAVGKQNERKQEQEPMSG